MEARRLLATSVWDGGGDGRTWLDPLNWSDRQVPSAGTDVLIPNVAATSIINLPTSGTLRLHSLQSAEHLVLSGATLSLDTPSTLARLTMSGGTLSGTGEVTVTGLFDWRGGTITSTDPASVITLAGGLEMTSGTRVLSGRTLVLASDTQWTGGTWQINGHATIINRPGAVLSFASTWLDDTGANTTDTLINEGTLRKNSGAGTATLEFDLFDLRAGSRIEALLGTIDITGPFTSAGHWEVAQAAMIDWQADKTVSQLHAGTTSAGAGQLRLVDGTVAVLDDVTLNSSFTHTAGTLTGPATLTLAGPVMWDGGMQQGTESGGQTLITGGLEMTSGTRVLHGRTLVLQSDTQWTGGNWQITGGATIINRPGAVLSLASTWLDDTNPNTTDTLINEGTVRKNRGAGTATLEFDLFDLRAGARVEALLGTIDITGPLTSAGHWEVAQAAMIDWQAANEQSQLHAGTTSAGAGQLRLVDGTVSVLDDVTLNSPFTHTAGTLTGPATLTLAGPVVWDGGTQQGTESGGQTLITGGLEMTSGTRVLHGRTLVLQSDTQWTGGNWQITGGATIINRPGAVLSLASTWLDDTNPNTTDTLINEGTVRKTSGSGTATVEALTHNWGTITAEVGTVHFSESVTQESGSLLLSGGGMRTDALFDIRDGLVAGSGQLQGAVRNAGTLRPGGTGGRLKIVGNLEQTATGVVDISWAGVPAAHSVVEVTGTATLAGTLRVSAVNGFTPDLNTTIVPLLYGARGGEFSGVQAFVGSSQGIGVDYLSTSATVTVIESTTAQADMVRQQLDIGTAVLREQVAGWSLPMGLPDDSLPLLGNQLDGPLAVAGRFLTTFEAGLPAIAQEVLSFEELRTALQSIGLTVLCVAGEPGCEVGTEILVRFDHTLEDIVANVPLDALTPGVLQGLADTWSLSGDITVETDIVFSIVFGVDTNGFFLHGSSRITLQDMTLIGSVSGAADIGGGDPIALDGVAGVTGHFTIDLVPAAADGRYGLDVLWADPASFLRVRVTGDAQLSLEFAIGPAQLTWEGWYDVATDSSFQIDVQLDQMFLSGTVSLPELNRLVNGVPESGFVAVDASYVQATDTWHVLAEAETSAVYQLGGLTITELVFDASIGPQLFTGDFTAQLAVPAGHASDPVSVDVVADFGSHELSAVIVTAFNERYFGQSLLWLQGFTLTTFLEAHFDQPSLQLDFLVAADQAVLFVDEPVQAGETPEGLATLTGFRGTLSRAGVLDVRIDAAQADLPAMVITATGDPEDAVPAIHVVLGPNQPPDAVVLGITEATVTFPALDKPLSLTVRNLKFTRGGTFSMDEAELVAETDILDTLGFAGILPLGVTRIHVAGIHDLPFTTEHFAATFTIDGQFDFRYLADTPFEHLTVTVGEQSQENDFTFTFTVANGTVRIDDTGPITVAIPDMEFGPLVIDTSLTVGAYVDGEFLDNDAARGVNFNGFFEAKWMQGDATVGAGAAINAGALDILPTVTRLDVNATFDVTFTHPESPFTFEDLGLTFDLLLEVSHSFEILTVDLSVLNATADFVEIHFGDLFLMRAEDVVFDFTVFGDDGSDEVPFATFGDLTVQFGDPEDSANPLSGMGGSAGNFGVGFVPGEGDDPPRPRFYQLPDFFLDVDIPNVFPEWLPLDLNEFGFKFPDADVLGGGGDEPVKIDKLSNASLLASGGMQGNSFWPITGLVEDLEISIQDLKACGQYLINNGLLDDGESVLEGFQRNLLAILASGACPFPVKNLEAVEIAIEPVEFGGVAIGGGLGLGILDIDVNGDGDTDDAEDTTTFYGRILGQLEYSDMGFGAELIVTQYGPVLGRLYVGVPVPIGALVGAVIGAFFFGVGASAGYQIGDATGFILTGFEGGMTFGDPLATIEDPLDILYNNQIHAPLKVDLETTKAKVAEAVRRGEMTWDSGFTLAVSGVLTNKYVNGMIGSKVTLGANVGYGDEVGFQLYGISDVIEVMDIPVVSAGILFDFTDPDDPSRFNPLSPTVNMAFALPGTRDSVLAMLLPAKAELGIQLTTDGLADAAAAATRQFLLSLLAGSLAYGQALFDTALTDLAGSLEAERSERQAAGTWSLEDTDIPSRLLYLIVDANGDDVLSGSERSVQITRQRLITRMQQLLDEAPARAAAVAESFSSRLLDVAGLVAAHLGENDPSVQQILGIGSDPYFIEQLQELVAATLPVQFYAPPGNDPDTRTPWPSLATTAESLQPIQQAAAHSREIYAAFAYHVQQAILDSANTFFDVADPALTVSGALQPYLLGIPLGDPLGEVAGRVDKHGVTLSVDTTVGTLFNAATLVASLMGAPDMPVGMTVTLPIGDTLRNVLLGGEDFPLLDPDDQRWLLELRTGLRIANFDVATIKGLGFPAGAADQPVLLSRLQKVFEDPDAAIDKTKVPIQTSEHFDAITTHGGILLSGILQVPRLITDPAALLASVKLQVPESVLEYPAWLGSIVRALTAIDTPGQFQLFAPSIAAGLTLHLADPCPAGSQNCQEEDRIARDEDKIADIVSDAYVEGTWQGKLLGIPLGNARIDGTVDGLEIHVQDPLLGLDVTVLASLDPRAIGGTTVMFPRARAEVTLDTDQAYDLLDKLNLPEYLREEFVEAEGTLRWYSPGYSSNPNEPDRLQRVGGLVAEGSLTADLFDVFDATFTGSLDSTGSYQFAAEDLSFAFPFGVGTISGQADFDLAGNVGTSDVELEGQFSGSLKVGNTRVATVNAAIDPYGCLQGNVSYLDSKNKIEFLQYPLQFGACGPQVLVDDAEFLETDVGVEHEVTVRLTRPAISDVVVFYNVEPISDNLDPRDKATEDDVVFHSTQKTVTIPQGQDQASLKVTVKGDNFWENPEIFQVRVVAAPGVTIADGTAIVTILDDDLDQLIDNVWGALEAGSRAIAWYDFQDDQQVFDATADDAPPVIVASPMTHALELEPAGRTGLPGENGPGRGASSTQWNDEQGYFEFTVTFDHDEPLDVRFDHLQFWDQTEPGKFNQRYQGPQVWEVFTSLDDFQTPLPREQTIVVDSDFFVQHGLPENTELDQLLGWRRQRFLLDSAVDPGYVSDLPLDLTFRLYGQHNVPTIIDNVELAGRVINPCESDLELACVARIVDDVVRWLDSLVGRIDVSVLGPGVLSAELIGRGGDIDPTRMQELAYLEVIGADPDLTTLLIEVENPGDLPAGASIPLGTVVSDKGLLRLDMSAIASALVNLEIGGPVSEMLVGGLADGSGVSLGGSAGDLTSIVATEDIGSAGGSGVSLATLGSVAVSGKSWYGGTWGVGAVTTVEIDGGDFTPDVAIEGGFDTFTVIDGNFAPPTFASGVAAGVGNGGGNVIQTLAGAKGLGGSILAGKLSVDGHLSGVQAMGGKIATNLTAQRIGSVQANRSARPGDAGNIEGRVQGTSIDSVQSLGGVITATLITSDPVHRGLEIEATAESQFPGSGRIDSRRSFHIAGGVASIRAHDIALHLVAGDRVDRIELIGDQGSLVADLTAPSFGLLQGRTAHLDLVLNTAPTQQPPPAGTMSWEVVAGASGALLDFELAEVQRQMALTFTVDEQGVPEAMKAERLTPAAFEENVSGGTIGPLGVPTVWNGESLTVAISDSRFEIRKGQLALRRESHLQSNEQGGELVEVSAATADGRSRWFETFVVTVADNPFPWHHTARPLDTNGDDEVSPRDALLIINRLNAGLPTLLPSVRPAAEHEPIRWYDVAPDGFATARDALLVINHLNRQPSDGEGEGAVDSAATIDAVAGAPAVERIRNILRGSSSVGPREAAGRTASERSTDSVSHQRDLRPHATEFLPDSGLLVGTADAPVRARDDVFRVQAGRREQVWLDEVLDDLAIQTLRLTASSNPH